MRGARNLPCITVPGKRAPTAKMCESNEYYVPLNDGYNWKGDPNATLSGLPIPQLPPGSPPAQAAPPPGPAPPPIAAAEYHPATGTYVGPDGRVYTHTAYLLKWTYAGQVTFVAVGPVGGVDYPRTYQEFRAWFPDDASCADYLARLRWPEGFRCPVCGGDKAWQTSTQHWKCAECGRKTSVTAGTIFHRTRTPLSTWFAAIWLVTSQKNGASAQNLHDMLGLGSYETAWAWLHKLRRAMVRPERELLAGVVEVDESFVGGRATGRRGASTDKVPVMIAVENVGTQVNRKLRLGRVRLGVADAPGSIQLVEFARTTVAPGSLIRTDGARMFRVLAQEGYTHQYISGYSSPEPGHVTLPGPHRVASLLKRWNAGTHHYRVEREHLQYYLDEFAFRFNRRTSRARGLLFYRLLQQSVNTDPHPLADLIGGTAVTLRDEELNEETSLEPLPSNTFGEF